MEHEGDDLPRAADQPQMEGPASSADAAAGGHGCRLLDMQALENLVAKKDWDNVEKQLKELVSDKKHPCLFMPVYEVMIADRVRKKEYGPALKLFCDKVAVLNNINSDFVNENDLKQQVSRLHKITNFKAPVKATSAVNIRTALTDYVYLYLSKLLRHDIVDCQSHLWRFARLIKKPRAQKNPSFKCRACGATFKNCSISKMRDHLDIRTSGTTCLKLTRNLQIRFEEGERQKEKTGPKHHDRGESPSLPRHGKVGRTAEQNLVTQDSPSASEEEETDNTLIPKLVTAVHASAESLHIASAGKPLEPKVEEQLRAARDLLGAVLSQKSKRA